MREQHFGLSYVSVMLRSASVSIVALAFALSGCSNEAGVDQGRLIVQGRDEGSMAALIEGEVTIEDGCTRINDGARMFGLVWPFGTKWLPETNSVLTPDGDEVTDGTAIRSGGGAQSSDDLSYFQDDLLGPDRLTEDRLACAAEWWVLANAIEVIDS